MPGPRCGQQHAAQQEGRLIHSSLNGHPFSGLYVTELGKRPVIKSGIACSHLSVTPLYLSTVIALPPIPSIIPFGYSRSRIICTYGKKRLSKLLALCKC